MVRGTPMYVLCRKLQLLQRDLKSLNKQHYWDISTKVAAAKLQLEEIQQQLLQGAASPTLLDCERSVSRQYMELRAAEESFFRQKARVDWLSLGDNNTSYFHQLVKIRRAKCTLKSLITTDGRRVEAYADIAAEAVAFYQNLLGTEDGLVSGSSLSELRSLLRYRVREDHKEFLIQEVTPAEIKQTLWGMDTNRAPGPDGYNVHFFKAS